MLYNVVYLPLTPFQWKLMLGFHKSISNFQLLDIWIEEKGYFRHQDTKKGTGCSLVYLRSALSRGQQVSLNHCTSPLVRLV